MLVNGLGAAATGATVVIVLLAKFTEGAWITLLLIPGLMFTMRLVKRHYEREARETDCNTPAEISKILPPLGVLTIDRWSRISQKALRTAWALSLQDIRAVHVHTGEESDDLRKRWPELVEKPARESGWPVPKLVVLESKYRFVIRPILEYVLELERANPERQIAVLIPELVERTLLLRLLHNHRSTILKTLLLFQGDRRITVIDIPWYLE